MGQGGMIRAGDYIIFYGRGNENHKLETGFFVHHKLVQYHSFECACTKWGEK